MTVELNPYYSEAYTLRGMARMFEFENMQDAILDFHKAIELDPEFWEAYKVKGMAYSFLSEDRLALYAFSKAIELNPYSGELYYQRSSVKYNLGNITGSCNDLAKAIELGHAEAIELCK